MDHISLRRRTTSRAAGVASAIVLAAAGLALGAGAGPASAAPTEHFLVTPGFSRTVPLRAAGQDQAYRPLTMTFYDSADNVLRGVRIAVDGSALRGFAELDLPHGCSYTSSDHLHESCSLGDVPHGAGEFSVGVRAAAGAKAGSTGQVVFTMTAANGTEDRDPHRPKDAVDVTVGDGPDLAITDLGDTLKTAPGSTADLPLQITNLGNRDGKGVVIFFRADGGPASVPGNFSNCVYGHLGNAQTRVQCTFPDVVIKAGQTLQPATAFSVRTAADSHAVRLQYGTGFIGADWIGQADGTPGTGAPLTLVPATGTFDYDPSKDIDTYNNLYYTYLETGIVTDISAVPGTVDTVIGKDTPVTFSARNSGTTPITYDSVMKATVTEYIAFPGTVRVTSAPRNCTTMFAGPDGLSSYPADPKIPTYACRVQGTLQPGQSVGVTFHIVVSSSLPGRYAGLVVTSDEDMSTDWYNDFTHVAINAKAGSPGGTSTTSGSSGSAGSSGSSGSTAGNAPSTDGSGSGTQLAATGSSGATLWTAVGGVAGLGADAVALAAARRRRSATGGGTVS